MNYFQDTLFVIPARGGSKGLIKKNILPLFDKPLICYSIDLARQLTNDENICVSTDDKEIIKVVENYGLEVPFIRPAELATDNATTNDVLIHAIKYYEENRRHFNKIILLQPTSPLRTSEQIIEADSLYSNSLDMVVSVRKSHAASVICNENKEGYLELTLNKSGERRQNNKEYYEYNGSIYIINIHELKKKGLQGFTKKVKYVMPEINSIDIDTELDFKLVELILEESAK